MNNQVNIVKEFQSEEQIQEQACLWISRMDRGLTNNEQQELVIWCNQNTNHHNTLLEMASYWDDISVLNELSGLFPLTKPKKTANNIVSIALAASVALVSLFSTNALMQKSFLPFFPSLHEQSLAKTQTLISPVGEQSEFTLSDGTHVQLNTDTIVNVAYTDSYRQLTLVKGEAKFDVAKDKSRPFTVTSGDNSFTALGTIFNVQKNDKSQMELIVTEGRVLITKANEAIEVIKQTLLTSNENTSADQLPGVLVIEGEKALIKNNNSSPVERMSQEQAQRALAWQQGMLVFDGEPLSKALLEVSRYTESKFAITNTDIADIRISGYFKANDIEGLLASLQSNFNISNSYAANNTILLGLSN